MSLTATLVAASPLALMGYAYVGYPALLKAIAAARPEPAKRGDPAQWPFITITVPVYNEERAIAQVLDRLLAADYPADRREILVLSDASTDRTDEIVRGYADRGVKLLRMPVRKGKTANENAGGKAARGEILINADATVRIDPQGLKALVRAFQDPTVGVASGRDVSVGKEGEEGNRDESKYVGYEMQVRALETRVHSIVGASGCFFAVRRECNDSDFPESLSRDFASCLIARERGYRAVSVDEALCYVPRTASLQNERSRKVRTMARGLQTLWYKRHLLNPFRYGVFSWMLWSHKLARWLVYPAIPFSAVALAYLAVDSTAARAVLATAIAGTAFGLLAMKWNGGRKLPRLLALPGFVVASNLAGLMAWVQVIKGTRAAVWEPTRRPV